MWSDWSHLICSEVAEREMSAGNQSTFSFSIQSRTATHKMVLPGLSDSFLLPYLFWDHSHRYTPNWVSLVISSLVKLTIKIIYHSISALFSRNRERWREVWLKVLPVAIRVSLSDQRLSCPGTLLPTISHILQSSKHPVAMPAAGSPLHNSLSILSLRRVGL